MLNTKLHSDIKTFFLSIYFSPSLKTLYTSFHSYRHTHNHQKVNQNYCLVDLEKKKKIHISEFHWWSAQIETMHAFSVKHWVCTLYLHLAKLKINIDISKIL